MQALHRALLISFIFMGMLIGSCGHLPDTPSEPVKRSQVFDADEKIVVRAITRVLLDRGFGEAKVAADQGLIETDYIVQGKWRTKVFATVKKTGRKKTEVTLSVLAEKKSFSQWLPQAIMGKEQYETFFDEIEIQIYREWYKGE